MAGATPPDTVDMPTAPGPTPRVHVAFGAASHPGRVRAQNEDHYLVARLAKSMRVLATSLPGEPDTRFSDEEGYLMVVADGMGGAAAGEKASALAVASVEAFVLDTVKWFLHLGAREETALAAELRTALERADRTVIERARADASLSGMGTTLTMAFSVGADLYIAHAGDSRAYLFRGGDLERLTSDHTLVQMLVDGGQLSSEAARHHPRRHVVMNVVGGPRPGLYAELHKVALADGDVILICSDGLTEPVDEPALAEALARHPKPDDTARELIRLALDGGGPDNVTVVVARYGIE
jgi:protein phosphatase